MLIILRNYEWRQETGHFIENFKTMALEAKTNGVIKNSWMETDKTKIVIKYENILINL